MLFLPSLLKEDLGREVIVGITGDCRAVIGIRKEKDDGEEEVRQGDERRESSLSLFHDKATTYFMRNEQVYRQLLLFQDPCKMASAFLFLY